MIILLIRHIKVGYACKDIGISVRKGPDFFKFYFLIHQHISQRAKGVNLLLEGAIPEILRKPLLSCDFPWGPRPTVPPLDLP